MSNEYINKPDMWDRFYTRFVHSPRYTEDGKLWLEMRDANKTLAKVVYREMENNLLFQNNNFMHVERIAIEHLKKKKILWQLFINNSPCNYNETLNDTCCDALISWKESDEKLNLEIICANLYNIRRPSCLNDSACSLHSHWVREKVSKANEEGLRKLDATEGITLRTFTAQDWDVLASALGVENPRTDTSLRAKEDERMAADLQTILAGSEEEHAARMEGLNVKDFAKDGAKQSHQ